MCGILPTLTSNSLCPHNCPQRGNKKTPENQTAMPGIFLAALSPTHIHPHTLHPEGNEQLLDLLEMSRWGISRRNGPSPAPSYPRKTAGLAIGVLGDFYSNKGGAGVCG